MSEKRIYRRASLKDVEDIYRICCKMQLENKPKSMSKRGFLISHYTENPEMKKVIEADIFDSIFLVCETRLGILGFLQGYPSKQWQKIRPDLCSPDGGEIIWLDERLRKIGIQDIHSFNGYGVLEKITVDKTLNQKRVALGLIKLFGKILLEMGKTHIMSEIVTAIYRGDDLLNIANKASITFHRRLGFTRVGTSNKYRYEDSYLGKKGYFKDDIYMARISALPYTYRRLFRVV